MVFLVLVKIYAIRQARKTKKAGEINALNFSGKRALLLRSMCANPKARVSQPTVFPQKRAFNHAFDDMPAIDCCFALFLIAF